jgi:predicted GNAT superfamily acetyltransferase
MNINLIVSHCTQQAMRMLHRAISLWWITWRTFQALVTWTILFLVKQTEKQRQVITKNSEIYLLKMPQSSTSSQTETFRRYSTEIWEIFTTNTIITDVYTDGYILSAFHRELKNIYFICYYYRLNISRGNFFFAHFPSVKS